MIGEHTLAQRYSNAQDLWTGQPLTGEDAREWLRLQFSNPGKVEDIDNADEDLSEMQA